MARAAALAALGLIVVWPLAELLAAAAGGAMAAAAPGWDAERTRRAAGTTLLLGVAVTALAVPGGTAAAWVTERSGTRGRRGLRLALLVPLVVPGYVSALSWARAYGPAGLTDMTLGRDMPGVYGVGGVVVVLTVESLPLAYAVVAAALAARGDPDLERAARASGADALATWRTVTLPLLRPALLAASTLVFVTATGAFGVPALLGRPGGVITVTTEIYEGLVRSADLDAFARVLVLAAGLMVVALVVIGIMDAAVGSRLAAARGGGPAGGVSPNPPRWWPAALVWAYVAVAVAVPLTALVLMATTKAVGLAPVPANLTLANFVTAMDRTAWRGLRNSLLLATVAAGGVVLLGSLLAAVRRRASERALGTAAVLTFAVPGSALAVAVLLAYGGWLRDTLALIAVAYLAKLWAVGHRTIAGALDTLPADHLRAARASGAGPIHAGMTVALPELAPAIGAAAMLAFLFAFHELTMSSLLVGPGTQTLAVVVLNLQQLGDVTAASALAVLLTFGVMLLVAPAVIAGRLARRRLRC